ncbi:MAG TPA: hypothetical protein VF507_08850 [Pyrinomonadaceae bacterium]|jgi:hypothetical protein
MGRKPPLHVQLVTGLLVGLFLSVPAAPVRAIPVEVVSDTSPTSLKQLIESTKQTVAQIKLVSTQDMTRLERLAEYVKQGSRWLETVQHYAAVVESNLRRFTTLKGIMGFAEQQLGLNEDTLKALAAIGKTVQGVFTIKAQMESLVTTRLSMLRSIEERARAGIFNPGADLDDLEEYLRTSIGRDAQQVVATRERLAQFDNELERWTHDLETYRARKVFVLKLKYETQALLKEELQRQQSARAVEAGEDGRPVNTNPAGSRVSASSDAITALNKQIFDCETELNRLDALISDLLGKIEARYRKYHIKFDDSHHQAADYEAANRAWDDFLSIKNEAALEMLEGFVGDKAPRLRSRRTR